MSARAITYLPTLATEQAAAMSRNKKTALITQLLSLVIFLDTMLIHLLCFSDPFNDIEKLLLWVEACLVMAYYRKIFKPLIRYITRLQLSGRVRRPIQRRRYADPSAVFVHVLRLKLYNAYCVFQKRHDWWIAVFQGVIHENNNLMNFSTRSLPEILAESVLMSTIPTPSMRNPASIGNWLCSLPRTSSRVPNYQRLYDIRLDREEIYQRWNLNSDHEVARSGSVACVSAVLFDQTRFGPGQQRVINGIVGSFRRSFHHNVSQICGYTELECRALPANHPDKAQVENELPMVKKQAILGLDMNILGPPTNAVLDEFRQRAIGLAYSGQTFALKARCYACRLIYPFAWPQGAQHVVLNRDKDLETVAELDLKRIGANCGCCGEALSFVQAMWHIKQGDALMHIYP
ncbi:MAG: hypothetical protein Q9177_000816 [Variospora cf. flavescens]